MSIRRAAIINAASKYCTVFVNLIANMMLARILDPEDYGVVAVMTVFSTFFLVFSDMGIGSAVIQDDTLTSGQVSDIFSWTAYIGLVLSVLFVVFSFGIANFYQNGIYVPLGSILSLSIFFSSLNMVPNAMLLKKKKFVYSGIRNIIAALVNLLVTFWLAIIGLKAYSIIWGTVANTMTAFLINMAKLDLKFTLKPRISSFRQIFNFSVYQLLYMIVNYFSRNLDNLLAGKVLGELKLGYYDKAYKLMLYPINNFAQVINPVLHPLLSEYKNDWKYIYKKYISIVELMALAGFFCTAICWFGAEDIICILYGEKWISATESFRILSVTIGIQMISSSAGSIYQSLSKTKLMFVSGFVYMVETVVCIIVGLGYGSIEALAVAVSVSLYLKFFIEHFFLIKIGMRMKLMGFYKSLVPYGISLLLSFFALTINKMLVGNIDNHIISLGEIIVIGGAGYLLGLTVTGKLKTYIFKRTC